MQGAGVEKVFVGSAAVASKAGVLAPRTDAFAFEHGEGSAVTHYDCGVRFAEQGQIEAAIQSYTRASSLDPTYPQPLNNLAALFTDTGQLGIGVCFGT